MIWQTEAVKCLLEGKRQEVSVCVCDMCDVVCVCVWYMCVRCAWVV